MKMTQKRKKQIAETFLKKMCNVSATCLAMNISRYTFYETLKKDKEFKELIEDAKEALIDNAETMLQKKILESDTTALIFFLKTKGKDRGYTERNEIKLDENAGIDISIKRT